MSESYTRPTKLMVGIQPGPFAPYLIQYTSEMASFYQCPWIAAVIFQSEKISISDQKAINDLSHLVHQKNGVNGIQVESS